MVRLRAALIALIALIAAALVSGSVLGSSWTASIPADAASVVLSRTTLDQTNSEDPILGPDEPAPETWLVATACLDRLQRPAGALDLCWSVTREADADPAKDYYIVRLYGSILGSLGSGTRWAEIRARLVGDVLDGAFQTWPVGVHDGACDEQVVTDGSGEGAPEEICGRTVATSDYADLSNGVTWFCVGCLIPNHGSVPVTLHQEVGVPQGTVPNWEIFGDLGD